MGIVQNAKAWQQRMMAKLKRSKDTSADGAK